MIDRLQGTNENKYQDPKEKKCWGEKKSSLRDIFYMNVKKI